MEQKQTKEAKGELTPQIRGRLDEARKLLNTIYAASVDPRPEARSVGGPTEVFHPGDGRLFYGGLSWVLK